MKAVLAGLAVTLALAGPANAQPKLTICLQANDPPLSVRDGDQPSGFALALSRAIADRLGRALHVQWFISKDDPDTDLVRDTNALLSDGRCELMAEYPLLTSTVRHPHFASAKMPPFDGATPDDRRRWVNANDLAPTRPYRADALAVVLGVGASGRSVAKLADVDGLRIGVQLATLSDAIAMRYDGGRLMEHVVHLPDAAALFNELQGGKVDVAFADLQAFDRWHKRHGDSGLSLSGYRHSLVFNVGFVGLATNQALVKQVDAELAELQAHQALTPMAQAAGLTFVAPRPPDIGTDVRPDALLGD